MSDYIFILYSCKKNIIQANNTYDKIYDKLKNTKVYILYGDNLDDTHIPLKNSNLHGYKIIDDKYIVLNVDDYNLCDKTIYLIQTINQICPNIKGMFKCEDDIIINMNHLNAFIKINNIQCNDYIGNIVTTQIDYCSGSFYFLSKKSMNFFDISISPEIKIQNEDIMVGFHLNKNNIFPRNGISLYTDDIRNSNKLSYYNKRHCNELYICIKGGLGNQIFQIACGMAFAKKYNKKLVLNHKLIVANQHQNNDIERTKTTLRTIFPNLPMNNTDLYHNEFVLFEEVKNECFLFSDSKMQEFFGIYNNVILNGYFINYKYIPDDLIKHISIQPRDKQLLTINFKNVYFIHIRLGDYLQLILYNINLKEYYNYCINHILSINPNATFYICTNQYDDVLMRILNGFPKNAKYIIQDGNNNDIDTLYIMSSCCGAICSNSTLSFMGTILQSSLKNKDTIFMPYPFVTFVDGFNATNVTLDMYPEWCSVYNTLDNKIIK